MPNRGFAYSLDGYTSIDEAGDTRGFYRCGSYVLDEADKAVLNQWEVAEAQVVTPAFNADDDAAIRARLEELIRQVWSLPTLGIRWVGEAPQV
jgi:hypothetical protein